MDTEFGAIGAATLLALFYRFRVALSITTVVVIIGILTGTVFRSDHHAIVDAVGFDLHALKTGRMWSIPAATLIPGEPGITWYLALLVLVSVGLLEYLAGSVRALVTFFVTDWVGTPLTTLALWGLAKAGSDSADRLVRTADTGPSGAAYGAAAAALALLPRPWREVSSSGLFLYLAVGFSFQRLDVAMAHLISALLGTAIGLAIWRPRLAS
jgi:phosphatidylglycerol lysyltransferase